MRRRSLLLAVLAVLCLSAAGSDDLRGQVLLATADVALEISPSVVSVGEQAAATVEVTGAHRWSDVVVTLHTDGDTRVRPSSTRRVARTRDQLRARWQLCRATPDDVLLVATVDFTDVQGIRRAATSPARLWHVVDDGMTGRSCPPAREGPPR